MQSSQWLRRQVQRMASLAWGPAFVGDSMRFTALYQNEPDTPTN
jgi:hypothetical protein